jgi:hypothetical protein
MFGQPPGDDGDAVLAAGGDTFCGHDYRADAAVQPDAGTPVATHSDARSSATAGVVTITTRRGAPAIPRRGRELSIVVIGPMTLASRVRT